MENMLVEDVAGVNAQQRMKDMESNGSVTESVDMMDNAPNHGSWKMLDSRAAKYLAMKDYSDY